MRQNTLKTLLKKKKCFKLICGAGNENLEEVEKLVAIYAKAGCHFFDLSASEEVLKAAQRGLDFAVEKNRQKDYHFCISIGTKSDRHVQKSKINVQKCTGCGKCIEICPQKAIIKAEEAKQNYASMPVCVLTSNCIGCLRCQKVCEFDAISFTPRPNLSLHPNRYSIDWAEYFPQGGRVISLTSNFSLLSCIELHAADTDEGEADEIWDYLNKNFDGMLSLCIGRQNLSDEQVLSRIKRLAAMRKPYTTIIQADGMPMSGGEDDFETTLPAVEAGALIQSLHLPVYLMLSGGTNSKTSQLAKLLQVESNGIAVGSYARKIVRKYTERSDFYKNKAIFNEALKIAKELIHSLN